MTHRAGTNDTRLNEPQWPRRAYTAAANFAQVLAPYDAAIVDDVWLQWKSPAQFAALHPDWYTARWHLDISDRDVDWSAQDPDPWSYLQDAPGVRGLTVVLPPTATPADVVQALDASQ